MPEEPKGPLSGIVVADFSRILAGPYATMMLGDLGADIIKVESPGGDDTREWVPPRRDGVGTYYLGVNRNKRSVVLDLGDAAGSGRRAYVSNRADVFIQNFRPGGWPGSASTTRRWPGGTRHHLLLDQRLRCRDGAALPGYDVLVQGVSGLMGLTGAPDSPAYRAGISVFDVLTGLHSAVGILAALHHRDATGTGSRSRPTCCPPRCRRW